MAIKKIDLGWITVKDIQKSKEFFTKKVGLTLDTKGSNEEHNWLELAGPQGGTVLGVCTPYEDCKPGQNAVMVFTVDDIVQTKKEMEARGVTFEGDIMELSDNVKLATFVDPDGNKFQLAEDMRK